MTRRFFLGGSAAFGAFGGCRFFSDEKGLFGDGTPLLRFGVVSDIHILRIGANEKMSDWGNNLTFRHTLEWFRDQGADAVMVAGDMADKGMVDQLEAVAEAWYRVFPDDRAPDGRKVEKVFVYGNHDYHGYLYGDFAAKQYPDAAERAKHVLRADMGGWWRKIFHEDYSPFYAKTIKGFTFLGQHWDDGTDMRTNYGNCDFGAPLQAFLSKHANLIDPSKPFFYVQHPHPKNTCYGPWAWGHDNGKATAALAKFPNAIAFSGHSHYSLTDERSIWQGAFTSLGTSSLRYTGLPYNSRHPVAYENSGTEDRKSNPLNAMKVMENYAYTGDCRQGMLVSVYGDRIAIRRREFLGNTDSGCDWVMPLPSAEPKPFAFAARAQKSVAPEFPTDAAIAPKKGKGKTRGGKGIPSVEKETVSFDIPAVVADPDARVFEFEVRAVAKDGKAETFRVLAEGFNHALSNARAKAKTRFSVSLDRLPKGMARFEVRPLNCWWRAGKPLVAPFEVARAGS